MRDFIERLQSKPEHIRRRIAVGTAAGVTGVVAAVWFFGLLFSGTLSLGFPENTSSGSGVVASTANGTTANIAGAGASNAFGVIPQQSTFSKLLAAVGISTAPPAPAALQVEDAVPASDAATTTDQTVIPF
jgi:hypothetical protein